MHVPYPVRGFDENRVTFSRTISSSLSNLEHIFKYKSIMMFLFVVFLALVGFSSAFVLSKQATRTLSSTINMLAVGDVAPDFELKNYKGKAFKLSSLKGKKNAVVFFYPADNSPVQIIPVMIILRTYIILFYK